MVEDAMLHERLENAMSLASGNKEVTVDMVQYEKSEKDNVVVYRPTVAVEVVEETASDEEKAAAGGKSFRQLKKQFPGPLSATKQSNTRGLSVVEDSIKLQAKSCVPKTSCSSANLSAMASKSVSYKEVAVAPPGTVLKPLMEPVEESNEKEPETQTCSITNETSMEEINTTSVVDNVPDDGETVENHDHGTQSEKSRSEHDEIPISNRKEPGAPPLAARVSCGPRSPLYYRNAISYRMKQGLLKYQTPMTMPSRSMNSHAPEFVPRKDWQTNPGNRDLSVPNESNSMLEKSKAEHELLDEESSNRVKDGSPRKTSCEFEKAELARQIILSFIVNSVQHNVDSGSKPVPSEKKFESSSDAIANDSAIIKVLYGDEEKTDQVTQSNEHEQSKAIDVNNKKNDDGEGFIVVRKRRRNRQFTNGVTGLYNQQSICASVR
ncbi:hypothetical protein GH714_033823 [Hevea brasiliensis]|uniref:Uncharacterized protein n=1 Tax=Hevea brasiliensis TaxID=3981 RepID=A0A6A6NAE4_HEVBR|nr:hypothetical protein GH714_033823 [Hevea brasiliensis]